MTVHIMPEVSIDKANARIRKLTDQLATAKNQRDKARKKLDRIQDVFVDSDPDELSYNLSKELNS